MEESAGSLPPFRRLRWRLTFSYTLVTVGALVVVELIVLFLLLLYVNSGFLTEEIVSAIQDGVVVRVNDYLDRSPPDLDGLNQYLNSLVEDSITVNSEGRRITRGLSIEFDQNYQFFVVDPGGLLLAKVAEGDLLANLGAPFDATAIPDLPPLLAAALDEDLEASSFYATSDDGLLVMALPIEGRQGDLLGAFIVTVILPTFSSRTFGSIGLILLASLIPITLAAGLIGTVFGFLTARGLTRRIESLSTTSDAWSRGDFSVMAADASADELGLLSRRLNLMAEQLQNLLHNQGELAGIEERNRLARELHDSVKQQVFATTMQIGAARAMLPADLDGAAAHLAEAEKLSHQSQEELAMLIQELRPVALAQDGLAKSLDSFAGDWSRQTGIQTQVKIGSEETLPPAVEQALFRVVQEALSNVARHSQAGIVEVTLAQENGDLILSIADDGRGFDPRSVDGQGYGLQSMRERVENLGGRLRIESERGEGTKVMVTLPPGSRVLD